MKRRLPGLYEQLITVGLEAELRELGDLLEVERKPLDEEETVHAIAQFLERAFGALLAKYRGPQSRTRIAALLERIVSAVAEMDPSAKDWTFSEPLAQLLSIHAPDAAPRRPDLPLARSDVLTGTRQDPSLASQLVKEIATADSVDMLVSFIRWSGLVLILDALRELTRTPAASGRPRLRVITTSYMGATDPRAVEELASLPNTEVRVSYDTARTRLHAKAYLIHRATGFGSAYVGSANISHAALTEGLEWTNKISQYELPHLWDKLASTFETYWRLYEFLPFRQEDAPRLREAVARESGSGSFTTQPLYDLRPFPFQEEILEALATERRVSGKQRQLVVAATGTGKTMIAAFDYQRWGRERPTLLFIAHRREILEQALRTFRDVLRDGNFGDLMTGHERPASLDHVFCTIQSFNSQSLFELGRPRFRAPARRPVLARRQAHLALEGLAEGGLRFVADGLGDRGDRGGGLAQELGGLLHAPAREVGERRRAHERCEALGEGGAGHGGGGGEGFDGPGCGGRLVDEAERSGDLGVGQGFEPARLVGRAVQVGADALDEEDVGQAIADHFGARGGGGGFAGEEL